MTDYVRKPGGFTIAAIRDEPVFKALHGNSRFDALLKDPKNRAPLF